MPPGPQDLSAQQEILKNIQNLLTQQGDSYRAINDQISRQIQLSDSLKASPLERTTSNMWILS